MKPQAFPSYNETVIPASWFVYGRHLAVNLVYQRCTETLALFPLDKHLFNYFIQPCASSVREETKMSRMC